MTDLPALTDVDRARSEIDRRRKVGGAQMQFIRALLRRDGKVVLVNNEGERMTIYARDLDPEQLEAK